MSPAAPLQRTMGLQSLLLADDPQPHVLFPPRLVNSSPVADGSLEAGLLVSDSDSDSGPPFLQVWHAHHARYLSSLNMVMRLA